eukprot:SAG31_NODE_301_length_18103_cov_13.772551_5_plen_58_part_00
MTVAGAAAERLTEPMRSADINRPIKYMYSTAVAYGCMLPVLNLACKEGEEEDNDSHL